MFDDYLIGVSSISVRSMSTIIILLVEYDGLALCWYSFSIYSICIYGNTED